MQAQAYGDLGADTIRLLKQIGSGGANVDAVGLINSPDSLSLVHVAADDLCSAECAPCAWPAMKSLVIDAAIESLPRSQSGRTALAALAAFAAVRREKELGAPLCARVSDLMPTGRHFNRQELTAISQTRRDTVDRQMNSLNNPLISVARAMALE